MKKVTTFLILFILTLITYGQSPVDYGTYISNNVIFRGVVQTEKPTGGAWVSYSYKGFSLKTTGSISYDASYKGIELDISKRMLNDLVKLSLVESYEPKEYDHRLNEGLNHTLFFNAIINLEKSMPLEVEYSKLLYHLSDFDHNDDKNLTDVFIFRYGIMEDIKLYTTIISCYSEYYIDNGDFMDKYNPQPKFYNFGVNYQTNIDKIDLMVDVVYNHANDKMFFTLYVGI